MLAPGTIIAQDFTDAGDTRTPGLSGSENVNVGSGADLIVVGVMSRSSSINDDAMTLTLGGNAMTRRVTGTENFSTAVAFFTLDNRTLGLSGTVALAWANRVADGALHFRISALADADNDDKNWDTVAVTGGAASVSDTITATVLHGFSFAIGAKRWPSFDSPYVFPAEPFESARQTEETLDGGSNIQDLGSIHAAVLTTSIGALTIGMSITDGSDKLTAAGLWIPSIAQDVVGGGAPDAGVRARPARRRRLAS